MQTGWPNLTETWRKRQIQSLRLTGSTDKRSDPDEVAPDQTLTGNDWKAHLVVDERRPGRRSLVVESAQLVIGISPAANGDDPPPGQRRALILDASWTHVFSFPDREAVRECMAEAFRSGSGRTFFISDLEWDLALFDSVASELRAHNRACPVSVAGTTAQRLWQAHQVLSNVDSRDTVLIGIVPGRDDRGAFQRLRSDFAERTSLVQAFPSSPLSTGPGLSRDEALGAWACGCRPMFSSRPALFRSRCCWPVISRRALADHRSRSASPGVSTGCRTSN